MAVWRVASSSTGSFSSSTQPTQSSRPVATTSSGLRSMSFPRFWRSRANFPPSSDFASPSLVSRSLISSFTTSV